MKRSIKLLLALLCLKFSFGQEQKDILIRVYDTSLNVPLHQASIIISKARDSMIVATGRTDSLGNFKLKMPGEGAYLIHVFFSGYKDYAGMVSVEKKSDHISISVGLSPAIRMLEDVIVRNNIAKIRFKGDTIEYRADSFLIDKSANVEELLKKLPGFYVDAQGRIQANGKKVEKVLVGGEEFFSEDPTLVTRSLRSEMVQKVQLYEKKSDQANFSKTNDSKSVQAINLELKPDKRKGLLGKASLSKGTKNYFDNQVMLSRFNGNERIAGYLLHSNTGTVGLSWQEQRTYSDFSLDSEEGVGNSKPATSVLDDWDGQFHGQGKPLLFASGFQYSDRYSNGVLLNAVGRYADLAVNTVSQNSLQYLLNDSLFSRIQKASSNNSIQSLKGVIKSTIPVSGSGDLVIGVDLSNDKKRINYLGNNELISNDIEVINRQFRTVHTQGYDQRGNASVLWRQKFKKDVRFTLNSKLNIYSSEYNGTLYSSDSLFTSQQIVQVDVTNQFKTDKYEGVASSNKAMLTIPFSAYSWMSFNTSFSVYNNQRKIESFNKLGTLPSASPDSTFSNQYRMKGTNILGGLDYVLKIRKINFLAGFDAGKVSIEQRIGSKLLKSSTYGLLFPSMSFTYSFNPQHRLVIYYDAQPIIPRVDQLQPVVNNSDPLNQQIGSPDLEPAYLHKGNVQYYWFLNDIGLSISGGGSFQYYKKGFATNEWIDGFGKRKFQWINVKGIWGGSLFGYFDYSIIKKWVDIGLSPQYNVSNYTHYINGQLNQTRSFSLDLALTTKIFQDNIFDFENRLTLRKYNSNRILPIRQSISTNNLIWQPSIRIFFNPQAFLRGSFYYTKIPSTEFFGKEQKIARLSISVSHRFLKSRQLEVRFSGFDILRNNTGVSRNVYSNYTSQQEYNVIGNYWQMSLQYQFSKTLNKKKS